MRCICPDVCRQRIDNSFGMGVRPVPATIAAVLKCLEVVSGLLFRFVCVVQVHKPRRSECVVSIWVDTATGGVVLGGCNCFVICADIAPACVAFVWMFGREGCMRSTTGDWHTLHWSCCLQPARRQRVWHVCASRPGDDRWCRQISRSG